MSVTSCLMKHLGAKSPINAYRAEMAGDVQELVEGGMTPDAAWIQVTTAKLADLRVERERIEQVVAEAYAKTAAGKPVAEPPAAATPVVEPAAPKPKVYKTRRGAEEAKAGNTQRIKKVKGGFILRDASEKEMAAAERNGRRLAAGGGVDVERDSLLTAIAKLGGIAMSDRADTIGEGNKNLAGKMLFTRDGKAIDLLASEDMIDFGYIPAEFRDDPETWLRDAIKSEFMGERSYFSEQGTEWMQEGVDQPTDAELAEWGIDELEQDGYTAASPEVQALTEQMIAEADALGIDTETIREDAARLTAGLPANDYHFAVQEAIRQAFRQVAADAARRDAGAAQAGNRDRVEADGTPGDQEGLTLTAPTQAQVLAQQDALEQERAEREAAQEKPKSRLTGDQVDIFNPQGSVFDAPAEAPAAAAQPAAESAARRTNPRSTIDFARPIVGTTGARLLSYTWQWKPYEYVDSRGEERVKRISDWDAAESSGDTGRDVVHQFVVDDGGTTRTVSAESALKMLGFAPASDGKATFTSLSSAAKTLARLRMQEAEMQQARDAFEADMRVVEAMPLPAVELRERTYASGKKAWEWVMGDADVSASFSGEPRPTGAIPPERMDTLIRSWRDNRMAERGGWQSAQFRGDDFKRKLTDLADRIKKQQAKVDRIVGASASATTDAQQAAPSVAAPIWEADPLSMGREQYVAARVESAANVNADPEHGVMRNYYGAKKGHQWERGFKANVEQAHFDAATKAAKSGAEVIDAVKYDYPRLFIRSDLSDDQADLAADAMTSVYRDTGDFGKAVQAYREFGALDLMGFERTPKGNGAFELRDGNMLVRVEPTAYGFQAAHGSSAKSGPRLTEQQAIAWAATLRDESKRLQGAQAAAAPAKPNTEDAGTRRNQPGRVENFGEALPPSRRQRIASLDAALSDDDIAAKPFSEIWPAAENEAIEDKFAAAVAHAARAAVPAKPRKGYKLTRWVESVKTVRQLAQFIVSGQVTREQFIDKVPKTYAMEGFMAKVALLDAIDRKHWKRIGTVREAPNSFTYEDGKQVKTPVVAVDIDGKNHWLKGSGSVADHIDAINELLGEAPREKRMEFEVRGRGNAFFINKKGDSEYRHLMDFTSADEATKARRERYDDLVAAWEAIKARDNVTESDTRGDVNADRVGPDHRNGRDITGDEFDEAFGFRGGEFGKWVSQGVGARERQWMLNRAYDALMDLAGIIGIPPRAISLNGTMGMAFGSRGSGKASAHFEPGNLVINLTKTNGAGALAHEWFHALDNYFARARGGEVPMSVAKTADGYRKANFITYRPEPMMVRKDGRSAPMTAPRLEELRKANPTSAYLAADQWQIDPAHKEGVRPEVEERFADLVKALNEAPMTKRASLIDKGKTEGYWSQIIERAARSFEAYVIERLREKGQSNQYLANVTPLDKFVRDKGRYPYPTPDEIKPVADAFDALFETIQTREDDAGNVAMFSIADNGEAAALQALAASDDLFALPKSDKDTIAGIAADVDPTIKVSAPTGSPSGTQVYTLTMPEGTKATISVRQPSRLGPDLYAFDLVDGEMVNQVTERPGENPDDVDQTPDVWLDVSKLTSGDAGARVYAIASNFAHNTGSIFIGDPAGLTDAAMRRRLEHMLSSALKFGTTRHLAPHPRQVSGGVGVPALKWIYGDDLGNIERMIDASVKALDNAMPTSKGIEYDTGSGSFRATSTGRELRPGELAGRSATAWMGSGLARPAVGGRRTIARGAVFRALLREARSGVQGQDGRRDGLLARIVGQSARLSSPDPAGRIFYKATGSPVATYDSAAYEPAGTADTEAVQRLAARLNRGVAREHHVVLDAVAPRARANGARARELAAVGTVARRIFGHRVVFVRFQGPPLFNGVASDTEPNVVFLHADSKQPLMAVLGHELLHRMRMETPNLYRDLQARLDRMMTGQSAYFDKLKAAYEHHGRTPPKEWMEELHADVVGDFFMDHRFWEEMAAEQPGLFRRVAAAILRFLDDVVNQLSDFRPFGTDKFVQDIAAARAAVAGAMRQFGGAQVGAMTSQSDGISLSVAEAVPEQPRDEVGRFARTMPGPGPGVAQRRPIQQQVRNAFADAIGNAGAKVSWWDKTLGTQYAKAAKFPGFKRVFDHVQQYLEDTSSLANEAANEAPAILPKLETWKDLKNFGIKPEDAKAIAAPIFTGTLTDQKVYSNAELVSQFNLNPQQIGQYRQFLQAVNTSLDQAVASDVVRSLGDLNPALRELVVTDRAALRTGIDEYLQKLIDDGVDVEKNTALREQIAAKYARIDELKGQGYAPLMRFGEYKLHIVGKDGETLFFGLYESKRAANKAARELASDPEFGDARFEQGVLSKEQYKMFAAVPMESLEMFAEAIGAEQSEIFQEYIKIAKSNRSALKRLIHRKGTAGFSEDVPRVLASFVTSNSRMAAAALNVPAAKQAALDIRDGDVQDEAVKLIDVVQNPRETAATARGLMFVNFIGGSIASAAVNLTQPITMTLPYLSQWGGSVRAATRLMAAGKIAAGGKAGDMQLAAALKRAERDGIVSPQEIHHLTAQAMGTWGKNPLVQRAAFIWGAPFSLAEQFNRRVTFIAAYNTARQEGMNDPFEFAEKAVIETQGLYNKANAPNWARNPVGATVLTFKQFSIHYLEWMGRMWNTGAPGSQERRRARQAVGVALALLVLAAGADGLPFADDLDDLIDTLGQAFGFDVNSKRARRDFVANTLGMGDEAADVAARGFSALSGIPLDVSLRMSMGNLIPGTEILLRSSTDRASSVLEVAGPVGGLAKQYMDAAQNVLAGRFKEGAQSALPVALQNVSKAVGMWATGEARDTRGRKVMDVDTTDGFMRFLGFNPASIARESEKMGMIRRSEQLAKNVEGEIVGKWARGIVDKDQDAVQAARADLVAWNERNPDARIQVGLGQIRQRVAALQKSREQRFITAVAPERRQAVSANLQ